MALGATHIRFAVDLKDQFEVQDINKYISGTFYPDSRFVTGIHRQLTHNDKLFNSGFAKNDFNKGWQVHQICDLAQYHAFRNYIDRFKKYPLNDWPDDKWVDFTSAKVIQDISDRKSFDVFPYLLYLNHIENPNDENKNKIKKYNNILIELYKNKISTNNYYNMMVAIGIDKKLSEQVKKRTEEFLHDNGLAKSITDIYHIMINKYKELIKQ
jgi:hypothetical protein